ncbi:MAG TPA: hypothetical protein PLP42_06160 [Acidobacteriota bacterium]|nr:hypothetical protein [Acidobacteriota bacterium]
MPTPEQIVEDLRQIANNWRSLALFWHVYLGALALWLTLGFRPCRRVMGILLALPFASVSLLAWMTGNPVNGAVFALATVSLALISVKMTPRPVRPRGAPWVIAGVVILAFGWIYPHFLETTSLLPYLYAAPAGLIPCPTVSIIIGLTLVLRGLESRSWSMIVGSIGVVYGLFGALRLAVSIDWMLVAGSFAVLLQASSSSTVSNYPSANSDSETGRPVSSDRSAAKTTL